MTDEAVRRAALILAGTGIVSAGTTRFYLAEGRDALALVVAYALYAVLVALALPRRPHRLALPSAFVAVGLHALWSARDGNPFAVVVLAAAAGSTALLAGPPSGALALAALALWTPAVWLFGPPATVGPLPAHVAVAASVPLIFTAVALFRRRGEAREDALWRAGVALLGIACVAVAAERHVAVRSLGVAPDDVAVVAVALALPFLAVVPARWRWRGALTLGLALALYALVGIALVAGKPYHADVVAVPHRAVEHLLAGEHPYRAVDAQEALGRFGMDPAQGTRREDGTFLRSLNYPALAVLVPAPFVALGLGDLRYLYLGEVLLLVLLVASRAPPAWRPLIAAAVVGNIAIARQAVLAGVDPAWALLVAVAWLFRDRGALSPLALGLAAAARQTAWLVAPFYVLAVARERGWPEALRRAALAAAAFAVVSLPFAATAPAEYAAGVLAPVVEPLVGSGVGLVGFALHGPLPLWPRGAYAALALAVLGAAAALLWKRWPALRAATPALALLPLWFAWRSLQNYFAFLGVFALLQDERDRTSPR